MRRAFADRLYLALLRLYPAAFRARFADEMLALFRDRHDRACGARRLGAFWISTIADVLRGASQARAASPPRLLAAMRLSSIAGDVVAALRAVVRSPAAPAAMMLLTALTIGAATTVFSLADAVLLTPPPFANPDRLVMIWERREQRANNNAVSGHEFPVWRERAKAFHALSAYIYAGAGTTLTGAGEPMALIGVRVTGSFFDVFDADPIVGRRFRAEDDVPGAPPVAIISHRLWRERFASDRDVVGRAIRISDVPHTVVGVAPEGFAYPAMAGRGPDVWTPIAEPIQLYRGRHYLYVVGRMRDGIALRDAQADLASVADALAGELPDDNRGHGVIVRSLAEQLNRTRGDAPWLRISETIQQVMREEMDRRGKQIYPNVDFFSASVYYTLGIPMDLFTNLFACARMAGWTAHVIEQLKDNRLIRPGSTYVGHRDRQVQPIERRA